LHAYGRIEWQRTLTDLKRGPRYVAYQDVLNEYDLTLGKGQRSYCDVELLSGHMEGQVPYGHYLLISPRFALVSQG